MLMVRLRLYSLLQSVRIVQEGRRPDIRLTGTGPDVDVAIGILIETDDGHQRALGTVATVNEAPEMAAHDIACQMKRLEPWPPASYPPQVGS